LDQEQAMKLTKLISAAVLLGLCGTAAAAAQQPSAPATPPQATFKAGVDLVRVSAVVRDRRGRLVRDMTARDFEVREGGEVRRIKEFRRDESNVSVAFLFDVSGSMDARMGEAREAAEHLLAWLTLQNDEAGVFTFDTRLDEVAPFTTGLRQLPPKLHTVKPFGATSLHDAVARTAEKTASR
jgi:VWFA-related protein